MSEAPPKRTFTTWKEIAQFFERDIRTVQRWEKEEGLPVHRHLHQRQSSVYAHEQELEAWRHDRGALIEQSAPVVVSAKRRGWMGWVAAVGAVAVALLGWWGLRHGTEANPRPEFALITLEGTRPGSALYGADTGDLNGDGVGDFVLSATEAREVYLYLGGKLPAPGREIPTGASVIVTGADRGSFGVAQVGDFNGDGLADLLLSVSLEEPESFREGGRSYILWGRREWPKTLALPRDADVTLWYNQPGDPRMGGCTTLSGPQDLNNDGMDDVLLSLADYGPLDRRSAGVLFVLWGRRTWPKQVEVSTQADLSILGSRSGEGLGNLCVVGDFNSDGKKDLGVVAGEGRLWSALGGRAKFYLFFGRERWQKRLDAKSDFDLRVDGMREEAFWNVPIFADVNGDGDQDLILGWPYPMDKGNHPGELQIWFGGKNHRGVLPADAADVRILGSKPGSAFGAGMNTTDLDGDGIQDLVVSAFGTGHLYLLYGRREWKKTGKLDEYAPVTLLRGDKSLGYLRIGVADLDADRLPEIVTTSSWSNTARGPKSGRAWILEPYLPVKIDVRPDKEPNVILQAGGVAVVRVSSAGLPADDPIDPASLRLGGAAPIFTAWNDFNGDGRLELQVHFESPAVKVPPDATRIALTGRTRSGRPIAGTDSVVVIPPAEKTANGKR